jgi:hypothetical protein
MGLDDRELAQIVGICGHLLRTVQLRPFPGLKPEELGSFFLSPAPSTQLNAPGLGSSGDANQDRRLGHRPTSLFGFSGRQ